MFQNVGSGNVVVPITMKSTHFKHYKTQILSCYFQSAYYRPGKFQVAIVFDLHVYLKHGQNGVLELKCSVLEAVAH